MSDETGQNNALLDDDMWSIERGRRLFVNHRWPTRRVIEIMLCQPLTDLERRLLAAGPGAGRLVPNMDADELSRVHQLELYRDGSGRGECAPFPLDNPICGWAGHASEHPQHVADVIANLT